MRVRAGGATSQTQGGADAALRVAVSAHKAGRLDDAENGYRAILERLPDHFDALHLLGVVRRARGDLAEGEALIRRALIRNPGSASAWTNLADLLLAQDRARDAEATAREATRRDPACAPAWSNLGAALDRLGRKDEAADAFGRALVCDPRFADAARNLGTVLRTLGRHEEAVQAFVRAVAADPDNTKGWIGLGMAAKRAGAFGRAEAAYRRALEIDSNSVDAWAELGVLWRDTGFADEAVAAQRRAIALAPERPSVLANLGVALFDLGHYDEAIAASRRAIAADPELATAHLNLALLLLLKGEFAEGWREYRWRWRDKQQAGARRDFERPEWDGTPLAGRTILVHAEQGRGDAIQLVRYAAILKSQGARVILECPTDLKRLLATAPGVDAVIARGEPLLPFDVHAPLFALPGLTGTALDDVPSWVPYLMAPVGLAFRLQAPAGAIKVGLAWAGNPRHLNDRNRSLPLPRLAPLIADRAGRKFFSLQVGDRAREIQRHPWAAAIADLSPVLSDFAATAAAIAEMDAVVAADTAVLHLAGAMGKSTAGLIPYVPDFRWLLGRPDSPWYPTMRLFRQPAPGDWETPIAAVDRWLDSLASS